eukprot:SAG22_NODE_8083_length_685_cov_0.796928_1_plen_61_part_10
MSLVRATASRSRASGCSLAEGKKRWCAGCGKQKAGAESLKPKPKSKQGSGRWPKKRKQQAG